MWKHLQEGLNSASAPGPACWALPSCMCGPATGCCRHAPVGHGSCHLARDVLVVSHSPTGLKSASAPGPACWALLLCTCGSATGFCRRAFTWRSTGSVQADRAEDVLNKPAGTALWTCYEALPAVSKQRPAVASKVQAPLPPHEGRQEAVPADQLSQQRAAGIPSQVRRQLAAYSWSAGAHASSKPPCDALVQATVQYHVDCALTMSPTQELRQGQAGHLSVATAAECCSQQQLSCVRLAGVATAS